MFICPALMSLSMSMSKRIKLSEVTFTLTSPPSKRMQRELLWCNKVPKGKRNKPAKIMGIQHHEISGSIEHDIDAELHSEYYGDDYATEVINSIGFFRAHYGEV